MIVAAEAISNDLPAKKLYSKSLAVIQGLKSHGVNVASYACDGTQVERTVQDLLVSNATRMTSYKVPDPEGIDQTIHLPLFADLPVVMIQDSKHALKTMRNNLFSGARALVLGSHLAMYSYARDLAFTETDNHPLYHRDVQKMDRQDDNAATCLFSAATLDFIRKHHTNRIGFAVYLFVMGETVDTYQSRHISHLERVRMALRCRYFLRLWRRFLQAGNYPETKYYISREANDILEKLVDGLLGLIYIYRDKFEGRHPLLPWLHSTETCEHVFAELRKLVKDFTHLNFLFMTTRLQTLLHASLALSQGTDPKARANGYSHSFLDPETAQLESLAIFPPDREIEMAAHQAWDDAVALLSLVGVECDDINVQGSGPQVTTTSVSSTSEPDLQDENEIDIGREESEAVRLTRLISVQRSKGWETVDECYQEKMHVLTCAAMALNISEMEEL